MRLGFTISAPRGRRTGEWFYKNVHEHSQDSCKNVHRHTEKVLDGTYARQPISLRCQIRDVFRDDVDNAFI